MDRPLAVTVEKPRFSWEWDAEENNVYQSAYQIIVQKEDGVLVWDSTRTAGRDTTDIEYAGQPLEPRRRYLYRITAWDQEGREAKSGQEYFETALWKEEDWKASWIEPDPLPQLETVPLKAAEDFWRETVAAMMRGEKAEMTYDEENLRAQPLEPYDPPVRMRRVFHLERGQCAISAAMRRNCGYRVAGLPAAVFRQGRIWSAAWQCITGILNC